MPEYTIDQLVQASSVPSSTIRMYGNRRLLQAPDRRGRIGVYDDRHLQRLKLIERMKASGYSLAAIGDLIEAQERGDALSAVLGTDAHTEPMRLTLDELAERFPNAALTQESFVKAMNQGLMRFEDDDVVLDHPQFLEIGSQLSALGFETDAYIDEYENLKTHLDSIAASFAGLFEQGLWNQAVAQDTLAENCAELATKLKQLTPLAESMVNEVLKISLEDAATKFVDKHKTELEAAGVDPEIFRR